MKVSLYILYMFIHVWPFLLQSPYHLLVLHVVASKVDNHHQPQNPPSTTHPVTKILEHKMFNKLSIITIIRK